MNLRLDGLEENFANKCIAFFCELLDITIPNLHVTVYDELGSTGVCYQNSKDEYLIILKNRDLGQMLVTLAHELVHVKQYLKDDLASRFSTDIPYKDRWWEIEAYEKEAVLIGKLIEKIQDF